MVAINNKNYSTTRLLTKEQPTIVNKPEDKIKSILFLPKGRDRIGEGGLRTKGYFKKSYEDKPLISIVTVVYNGKDVLEETIKSVINQSYDNVEYIIIDGGSNDGTLDMIRKYDDYIDYWVSEKDGGIYDAMNKGSMLATGDYINFMNTEDRFVDNTKIKQIVNCILSKKQDKVYYGIAKTIGKDNDIFYPKSSDEKYIKHWEKNSLPNHQAMFFPKKFYKAYSYNLDFKISADMNYKILAYRNIGYIFCNILIVQFYLGGISNQDCNFSLIWQRIKEVTKRAMIFKSHLDIMKSPIKLIVKYILCKIRSIL